MTHDATSTLNRQTIVSSSPGARSGAAACFNGKNVVLFGGEDGGFHALDDTWVFDTTSGWLQLHPATKPPARAFAGMAYDGERIVLFGGLNGGHALGDTWIFYGKDWGQMDAAPAPSPRASPGMCADNNGMQAVLFGGLGEPVPYSDTWFFSDTGWMAFTPAANPPLRERTMMAGAPAATPWQLMLFGGYRTHEKTYYGDTWGYVLQTDGGNWEQVATTGPSARADASMVFEAGHGVIVLFGGLNQDGRLGDTWIYDNGWQPWTPSKR